MKRRSFIKASSLTLAGTGTLRPFHLEQRELTGGFGPTLALNAYSFNAPLLSGEMSIDELFRFARDTGFTAVDLTAYYIPGYPDVPEDEVLYGIKKQAFKYGLAISGTGVRNDFTLPDPDLHRENLELVKRWIVAASKLGAPHTRVFFGNGTNTAGSREEVRSKAIEAFLECAEFAAGLGVVVAFQNHYDYIKDTAEVLEILERVRSEWFGLMLDTGSIAGPDPYVDIGELIPYAVSWQVKELIRTENGAEPTDFERLLGIVREKGYRGYFPLETLGEGEPRNKVKALYREVTAHMSYPSTG